MNSGDLIEQAKAQMSCSCKPGLVPTFGYKTSKMFSSNTSLKGIREEKSTPSS